MTTYHRQIVSMKVNQNRQRGYLNYTLRTSQLTRRQLRVSHRPAFPSRTLHTTNLEKSCASIFLAMDNIFQTYNQFSLCLFVYCGNLVFYINIAWIFRRESLGITLVFQDDAIFVISNIQPLPSSLLLVILKWSELGSRWILTALRRIFYYLISRVRRVGMRHEKSLGLYCSKPRCGLSLRKLRTNPRTSFCTVGCSGDIIIRYERVYEAANHRSFHISNGRCSLFSLMVAIFEFSIPPLRHSVRTPSNIFSYIGGIGRKVSPPPLPPLTFINPKLYALDATLFS